MLPGLWYKLPDEPLPKLSRQGVLRLRRHPRCGRQLRSRWQL